MASGFTRPTSYSNTYASVPKGPKKPTTVKSPPLREPTETTCKANYGKGK